MRVQRTSTIVLEFAESANEAETAQTAKEIFEDAQRLGGSIEAKVLGPGKLQVTGDHELISKLLVKAPN